MTASAARRETGRETRASLDTRADQRPLPDTMHQDAHQEDFGLLFVGRLRRLLDLQRATTASDVDIQSVRLVHKAIFSTWLDCIDAGADAEAAALMNEIRRPSGRAA
jgi:hypothetical protein